VGFADNARTVRQKVDAFLYGSRQAMLVIVSLQRP
jgi:hypothetical protein